MDLHLRGDLGQGRLCRYYVCLPRGMFQKERNFDDAGNRNNILRNKILS